MVWETQPPVVPVQTDTDERGCNQLNDVETNGVWTDNLGDSPNEGFTSTEGCYSNSTQNTLNPSPEYNFPQASSNQPFSSYTGVQSQWQPSVVSGGGGQNYTPTYILNPSFSYLICYVPYYIGIGYPLSANFVQPTHMCNPTPTFRTPGYSQYYRDSTNTNPTTFRTPGYSQYYRDNSNTNPAPANMPTDSFGRMIPEQSDQSWYNQPSEEPIAAPMNHSYETNPNENLWCTDEDQTVPTWNFLAGDTTQTTDYTENENPCGETLEEQALEGQSGIYCRDPYSQTTCELFPKYKPMMPSKEFLRDYNRRNQDASESNQKEQGDVDDDDHRVTAWISTVNLNLNNSPPPPPKMIPFHPKSPNPQPKPKNKKKSVKSSEKRSQPSIKSNKKAKHCQLCKSNRELPVVYRGHVLMDDNGITQCPVLRNFVCPICKATGDHSHTVKYCPKNKDVPASVKKSAKNNPLRDICPCQEPRHKGPKDH